MKKFCLVLVFIILLTAIGCTKPFRPADIVATTGPVCYFTTFLCRGTALEADQLVSDSISCLHDYSLSVSQVRTLEAAKTVVISGAGLEAFMEDLLNNREKIIDSSEGLHLLECTEEHDHEHDHAHSHEEDAHIWLAPENARKMATNICQGLCAVYPEHTATFSENLAVLLEKFDALQVYADESLSSLSCRDLITFHDGFGYLAHSFGLNIVAAIEEESGSEASAKELIELIELIEQHHIPAIFTEINGSTSASRVIAAETDVKIYALDMGITCNDYFEMMYRNIDTLKEALG